MKSQPTSSQLNQKTENQSQSTSSQLNKKKENQNVKNEIEKKIIIENDGDESPLSLILEKISLINTVF